MTIILAYLWAAIMLLFVIAFLVDWIRLRRKIRKYLRYGVVVGAIVVGLELLTLGITPAVWAESLLLRLCVCGVEFVKMIGFTTLGIHYCLTMNQPSFPLLLRRLEVSEAPGVDAPVPTTSNSASPANDVIPAATDAVCGLPLHQDTQDRNSGTALQETSLSTPQVGWRTAIFAGVFVAVISVIYSMILFWLTPVQTIYGMLRQHGVPGVELAKTVIPHAIPFVVLMAFGEEIMYRLGVQSFLARYLGLSRGRYWMAILITTTIWTMAHVGMLEPGWVKLTQIFPVGLLLGWLCKQYGVESSIVAHVLFNVIMLFAPWVVLV